MAQAPDLSARRAALSPHSWAFHDHGTGRRWTFAEVDAEAIRLGAALLGMGLTQGDRVGVLALNRAETFIALFAARKAGLVLCPLNWRAPLAELAPLVAGVGIRVMIHDADHADMAGRLGLPCLAMQADGGFGLPDATLPVAEMDEDAPWYLLFTSGTTGRPKAVIQTARMAVSVAMNLAIAMALVPEDRTVCYLPLFHTAGINLFALPLFQWGGHSHILPRFDADRLLALIGAGEVTQFFGVPTIWQAFAAHPGLPAARLDRLRGLASGGATLPETLVRQFATQGAVIRNGFGMTETGPTGFLADRQGALTRPASVGKPQLLTEARLDGVPDGAPGVGELLVRGATVTPGYFGDAGATAAAFRGGWLATGDIARRDADGYYFIVDRLKDMFVSGGENVWPAEVEQVLAQHPDIAEAAVIGCPDDRWGEVGAAFVIAQRGARPDPAALTAWCRERLAAFKVPRRFVFVADFPRTPSGKVRKALLRNPA
jgi:fatty-acyl-CoA synthase